MPRPRTETPPPGQRLLYWLAEAATKVRTDAGASPEHIAALLGVGAETIKRFERAKHWPSDPDRLVAAYAVIGGLQDAREIYQQALDLWYEHGTKPLVGRADDTGPLTAGQRFEQQIAGARRARPRDTPAREGTTSAAQRRKAGS